VPQVKFSIQDEHGVDGAGQPRAGAGQHRLSPHLAGVPRLSGPHNPSHKTMRQGSFGVLGLFPQITSLSNMQIGNVGGEKLGHGAGCQITQVPLQVSSHGMY